jgi:hypothetical protein
MIWKQAILEILQRHNGQPVKLKEIYHEMLHHPLVTEYHRDSWSANKQPRYQCWIRSLLSTLVKEGKVKHIRTATYQFLSIPALLNQIRTLPPIALIMPFGKPGV